MEIEFKVPRGLGGKGNNKKIIFYPKSSDGRSMKSRPSRYIESIFYP